MTFWTYRGFKAASGGAWRLSPSSAQQRVGEGIAGVSIDTRTLAPGEAFVAIHGEQFDGHDFLAEAVRRGASLLIVDRDVELDGLRALSDPPTPVLRVADTRAALGRIASAYRRTLDGTRIVAVTGSNGKTTTVRLIHALLSMRWRGTASRKSFNNDIGVPLTLLRARPGDHYVVCEVGMNHPGEIAALARLIEPDVAVLTSIGRAHMESFDSMEALASEKASLLAYLRPGGLAIVPSVGMQHGGLIADHLRPVPNVVTFGEDEAADLRLTRWEHTFDADRSPGLLLEVNARLRAGLPMVGKHNAINALAAIGVARRFGLDDDEIARGLASVEPVEMRMERRLIRGIEVYNDAYNANPDSVRSAIETFVDLAKDADRRVLVLGDMLELGDETAAYHREIAEFVVDRCPPDLLVTVGPMSLLLADSMSTRCPEGGLMIHSEMTDAIARRIAERLRPGDAVLLKASRGIGLERIVRALERLPSAAPAGADS